MKHISPEVFQMEPPIGKIGAADIELLKQTAISNPRKRARICAHPDNADRLHEMVIAHAGRPYVRPHRHPSKSESFHMIEGKLTVVLLDDDGKVVDRVAMGPVGSGRVLFYRLSACVYHTVLFEDDVVVFHETTNGPFVPGDAEFAPWGPLDDDLTGQRKFLERLQA